MSPSAVSESVARQAPRLSGTDTARADRVLGYLSLAMLAVVAAAVMRGHGHWRDPPIVVWAHLALLVPALALTPVMLIRRKGSATHRTLGYIWVCLLLVIALEGFLIPAASGGRVSPIWLVSFLVLVQAPRLVLQARRHEVARHRRTVRGLVVGAFLVAGVFTLPFGRMLGEWLVHG